jgi:hypothetical protein
MAVGYTLDWWDLADAIRHVARVGGTTNEAAAAALWPPLREGKISSRYRGQPIANKIAVAYGVAEGGEIPAGQWYRATIHRDASVEFGEPARTPLLGRPAGPDRPRHQVEVWRADVLRYWPPVTAPGESQPAVSPPPAMPAISVVGMERFVAEFVAEGGSTKKALWQRWTAVGHRGRRDDLFAEFNRQMGDAAPRRGRPRKLPEKSRE